MFWWIENQDRNKMRKIGYCRVSSSHQNLDRQLGALRAERVHVIFREKASGKSIKGWPELEKGSPTACSSSIERVRTRPSRWNGGKKHPSDLPEQRRAALAEFPSAIKCATLRMRRCATRGLPAYSIDGLDPRPRSARTFGDLAILRLDEMARWRVPVQAAQHGVRYFSVGRHYPVLRDDVEQYELDPRDRLSAPHPLIPLCLRTRVAACAPSHGHAARKLALPGHALEWFTLALDSVENISILDGKQPNYLVLSPRSGHAGTG